MKRALALGCAPTVESGSVTIETRRVEPLANCDVDSTLVLQNSAIYQR
jgi:hypothetical protein